MKHIIKLAVGAAIAGALVNRLMKRRSENRISGDTESEFDDKTGLRGSGSSTAEVVLDEVAIDPDSFSSTSTEEQRNPQQPTY